MSEPDNNLNLPKGIQEEAFIEAVENSGYPLQIVVGSALVERSYELEEEWAFGDPDSGERRAIDIVALRDRPTESVDSEHGTTEFAQALLIECKQSRHPYLFFESVAPPILSGFPVMLGIGSQVVARKGPPRDSVPVGSLLSVQDEPLMTTPPIAASLSRAEPKGGKVVISGEHSYKSLLMPLTKALADYEKQFRGSRPERGFGPTNPTYNVRLALPLAVVDAPMVFVGRPSGEPHLERVEWVRLIVRHPVTWHKWEHGTIRGGGGFTVVDVVSRSFLTTFLDQFWESFNDQFFGRFAPMNDKILGNDL
jgi:hypothetical protein